MGSQKKIGHPARRYDAGSRLECPRDINRLENIFSLHLRVCIPKLCIYNFDSPREIMKYLVSCVVLVSLRNILTDICG